MKPGVAGSFGTRLKALREAAGFTQEELATIAGLSVHAVSALERGERRRPHVETVRALSAALDLTGANRDALMASARPPAHDAAADELSEVGLPIAPTLLIGRDTDLQILQIWLADPTARLITLIGPGGVGKTRLALELARSVSMDGSTRVLFVPLAAIRNPAFVALAIAEALGLSDVTAADLPARARAACGDHPTFLTLDNFEQVLDAAPLIADLLTSVASLRVLTTSRAALRLRGEREYAVGPLGLDMHADAKSPADVVRSPAVRLFVERVRSVQPDFRLTVANSATVTAICQRLDALPLALEIAAPWLKMLTPEDLLGRLMRDALLSTTGPRDLPERQQTISATVAWSYQLLDPNQQRAFRRLGMLPARFSIEAATAVLGGSEGSTGEDEALGAVAGLIDRSLLVRSDTSVTTRPLYQMLETVRAYAAALAGTGGERDAALEGLTRHCTGEAARAAEALVGHEQAEWLNRVREDLENYRVVLARLIEQRRSTEASEIAWGLMFYWLIRARSAEGLQWCEEILNLPALTPAAESKALVAAAVMRHTRGEPERARTDLMRAVPLARLAGAIYVVMQAENLLGHIENAVGNPDAARDKFVYCIDGFRELAIPWGAGNALMGMAGVALASGDVDHAERILDEATSVLRSAGPWFLNLSLYIRAILAVRRGDHRHGIACVRESLVCSRQLHDKFAFVYALTPLAAAAAQSGNDVLAARALGARDAVTEGTGASAVDKSVHDLREQTERDVRARLGPDRWARAFAAGRRASIDSLLKDIDAHAGS
jgi:predicted ATPase/DNA-binding XRE family transcriptional regulator